VVYIEPMRLPAPPTLRLPRTGRSFHRPVAVSAAVHLAVLLLLLWEAGRPAESFPSGPPGPSGREGGGGGWRVEYLALPPYRAPAPPDQTRPQRPQPPPIIQAEVRDVAPTTSLAAVVSLAAPPGAVGAGAGAGSGGGVGVGRGPGTGSGVGRGGGAGEVFPPQALHTILPPLPKPASMRGKSFRVHFWVSPTGRVTRVDVSPPIPDGDYRKRFVQLMYEYTFTPAMRPDGTPVAGETVLVITL